MRGKGADTSEVGNKASAYSSVGEVAFHNTELGLCISLTVVKLSALMFDCHELVLVCPIPINVSNNTRVLEIYNGIVD